MLNNFLNGLIKFSLKNRLLILILSLVVLAMGIKNTSELPVEVLPDLTKPRVTIMTEVSGKAPEEVERYVTVPLEQAVTGIKGMTRVQSTSDVGLSLVFVEFDWGTDIYQARQFVQERIRSLDLGEDIEPGLTPTASLMGEIMLVGVSSPNGTVEPRDLRTFTDWTLRRRIQKLPGIAESLSMGGGVKQIQILPDPQKMLAYGISSTELNTAASQAASNETGGYINNRSQEKMIRILAMTTDLDEIKKTTVKKLGDRVITLADVAEVSWGIEPQRGEAGVDGDQGVILSITKSPGVDTRKLTKLIEDDLDDLSKKLKEDGTDIKLTPLFRQTSFINAAITNLVDAIKDGAIMVVIVLVLFLFSLRTPLISFLTTAITLTAIPLSFAMTTIIFTMLDISVNSMTLGGLAVAIGIVVDDAIVDVENVLRRLKENANLTNPKPRIEIISKASGEVRNSLLYATIFIILVFVPLLLLTGVEGRLFTPIAIATMASMAASFVVSLTVIPVLSSFFLRPRANVEHKDGIIIAGLKKLLEYSFMKAALRVPTLTVALALGLLTFSILTFTEMRKEFLPKFKEETLIIAMTTAPGTSLETTHTLALMADKMIKEIPEVKTVGHRAGRAERGDHVVPVSTVEFDIELHPNGRSRKIVEEELRERMQRIPGVFAAINGPLTDRIGHMLSGAPAKVAIKVYGDDLDEIRDIGKKIQSICQNIEGLEEAKIAQQASIPQLRILFDRDRAKAYGINAADFNTQVADLLGGTHLLELNQGEKTINMVSRLPLEIRQSPEKIKQLYINTIDGKQIQLYQVAKVLEAKGPNLIKRERNRRVFTISINPTVRDLPTLIDKLNIQLKKQIIKSTSYDISIEGEYIAQQEATRVITVYSIIILLVVTVLLFSYFGSMNFALQVITDIPLSLIGAIFFTYMMNIPISIASLVGFIAVAGISARNSIMLISHYIMLMKQEGMSFGKELIIRGTQERLLPVLMTAFSAGIALIPLVLAQSDGVRHLLSDFPMILEAIEPLLRSGESGKEILSPIAIAITGGLISSTILGLAVTPAVFYIFGRKASERALLNQNLNL